MNKGVLPELESSDPDFANTFYRSAVGLREVFNGLKRIVKQRSVRDGFGYRLIVVDPVVDRAQFAEVVAPVPRIVREMLTLSYSHVDANPHRSDRLWHTRHLIRFLERMLLDYSASRESGKDSPRTLAI